MQARAVLFTGTNQVELSRVEIPDPEGGEVLVRAEATCISPGTELRCLTGGQPDTPDEPYIPGYAMVGRVAATGERFLLVGTRRCSVARMWGGHVEWAVAQTDSLIAVPEAIPSADAAVAPLWAIAYHGVRLAKPLPGETVGVLGLGPIGWASARLFAAMGAEVMVGDRLPERVEMAARARMKAYSDHELLAKYTDACDVVVDATGATPAFSSAVALARAAAWGDQPLAGARILVQGSYVRCFEFPYYEIFAKEAVVYTPRDRQRTDVEDVLALAADGRVNLSELVTEVVAPRDAPDAYRRLQTDRRALTLVFDWNR